VAGRTVRAALQIGTGGRRSTGPRAGDDSAGSCAAAAAAAAQASQQPVFLPNGQVQIGNVLYNVPRGGTGGVAREESQPNWFVRLLVGRPFNAVSPRSGLKRPATRAQTLAKLVYGNPFQTAVMSVRTEKQHLRFAFDKFDVDHDGELTLVEFALAANYLGRELFPLQVQAAFYRIDRNRNGAIDFDEFCGWWFTEVKAPPVPETRQIGLFTREPAALDAAEERAIVARAFATFDVNGNGSLDPAEFKKLAVQIGANLSDAEVAELMKAIDTDGDGVITFDEFYVWFVGRSADRSAIVDRLAKNVREYSKKRWRSKVYKDTALDPERATAKRRNRARDLFDRFDADKNGHLDLVELGQLCAALGSPLSDAELRRVLECIDTDHNGTIEFEEFFVWFEADAVRSEQASSLGRRLRGFGLFQQVDDSEDRARARRAFERFDLDGNHVIDRVEFGALTEAMGVKMTVAEIIQSIASIDLDGNGTIDFDEFYAWWTEERLNAPKGDRAVRTALKTRVRNAVASFLRQPIQAVDWDQVKPGGQQQQQQRAVVDDNDGNERREKKDDKKQQKASKKDAEAKKKAEEEEAKKKKKAEDEKSKKKQDGTELKEKAAKKDDAKKEEAKKDDAKKGDAKKEETKKSDATKKDEAKKKEESEEEDEDEYEYEYESDEEEEYEYESDDEEAEEEKKKADAKKKDAKPDTTAKKAKPVEEESEEETEEETEEEEEEETEESEEKKPAKKSSKK
jgi:Ca2+-binding EF-hand superfamily protein